MHDRLLIQERPFDMIDTGDAGCQTATRSQSSAERGVVAMAERDESNPAASDVDAVVVGAGFSGLYLLHRLRTLGFTTRVLDAADDVGGTWYWNRYPGARCDIPTTDYSYSFDPELERVWTWSEKYATQPEILSYLQFVADRYDLRRDITFSTKVTSAAWDESAARWRVRTDQGEEIACRFYVMASGCLSLPKAPEIAGHDRFRGEVYFTSTWPHEGVDFTGKRVAVIGTGSSGIQSIPLIAAAGPPAHGLPAYGELLDTRSKRTAAAGAACCARDGQGRLSRCSQAVARRCPERGHRRRRGVRDRRGAARTLRGGVGGR